MNPRANFIGALVFVLTSLFLAQTPSARAQTAATGQIVGTITDPSKSTIPQATVTATNTATSLVRTAETNDDGDYVVALLPPAGDLRRRIEHRPRQR